MILKKLCYINIRNRTTRSNSRCFYSDCVYIKPKLNAEANINKTKEYYDFENMRLMLG